MIKLQYPGEDHTRPSPNDTLKRVFELSSCGQLTLWGRLIMAILPSSTEMIDLSSLKFFESNSIQYPSLKWQKKHVNCHHNSSNLLVDEEKSQ
jgi:hypothetical protein